MSTNSAFITKYDEQKKYKSRKNVFWPKTKRIRQTRRKTRTGKVLLTKKISSLDISLCWSKIVFGPNKANKANRAKDANRASFADQKIFITGCFALLAQNFFRPKQSEVRCQAPGALGAQGVNKANKAKDANRASLLTKKISSVDISPCWPKQSDLRR